MGCRDAQTLIGIVGSQVGIFAAPSACAQFRWTEHIIIAVEDVEHDLSLIGKARLFVFNLKSATIIQYTIKGRFMSR